MSVRLKTRHQDDIRAKIKADRIIAWLQAGIFGEKFQKQPVTLSTEKVSAAKALLNKVLPDLNKTEYSGPDGGPIPILTAQMSPEQAAAAYKDVMK